MTDVSAAPAPRAEAPEGGFRVWYTLSAGVVAWMVHVVSLAALVEPACAHRWLVWVMHALTAVTGAATILGLVWSYRFARIHRDDEEADTRPGRLRFYGRFGLLIGGVSLLLIAWEGLYVPFLNPCA